MDASAPFQLLSGTDIDCHNYRSYNNIFGDRIAQWCSAGFGLENRVFEFWQGLEIFLFTTMYRPDLIPTSLLSRGYQGVFPGLK
jgi:hypothetical protein